MVFTKMDASTEKPPPEYKIDGFPTIFIRNFKRPDRPIRFEGERNKEQLMRFVQKNGGKKYIFTNQDQDVFKENIPDDEEGTKVAQDSYIDTSVDGTDIDAQSTDGDQRVDDSADQHDEQAESLSEQVEAAEVRRVKPILKKIDKAARKFRKLRKIHESMMQRLDEVELLMLDAQHDAKVLASELGISLSKGKAKKAAKVIEDHSDAVDQDDSDAVDQDDSDADQVSRTEL